MGYYIDGPNKGKDRFIHETYGAQVLGMGDLPESFDALPADKVLVVVVDNGPFEAALVVFTPGEFNYVMQYPDRRLRTYLLLDRAEAVRLTGYRGSEG